MDAPTGRCAFCGAPSDDRHHITGRAPSGVYIDPDLIVDLCHRHHELVGYDARIKNLEVPPRDVTDDVALVVLALRRIALFFGRFSDYVDSPLPTRLAIAIVGYAELLDAARSTEVAG